jgi:transposase
LIEERLDLAAFDACYKNDETGAAACDPAILLKIILYAYSKGVTRSRRIEQLCSEIYDCRLNPVRYPCRSISCLLEGVHI